MRFSLVPTRFEQLGSKEFNTSMGYCKWVTPKPEAEEWFKANLPSLQSKYSNAMAWHLEQPDEKRNILRPQDGSDKFYN